MHAKKRGNRVNLYRSGYVRKGANGNTHGYPVATFVGSLPVDAQEIPSLLGKKLTADERAYVERVVIEPALRAMENREREAQERELDPGWRIDEALRLLSEASVRIGDGGALNWGDSVVRLSQLAAELALSAGAPNPGAGSGKEDPLKDALGALERATQAVRDGYYKNGPATGFQATEVYRAWGAITAAVNGDDEGSLKRALQGRGWVRRGSSS